MPWKGSMAMRSLVRRSMLTGHLFEEQEKPGKSLINHFPVVCFCFYTLVAYIANNKDPDDQTSVFASVMK